MYFKHLAFSICKFNLYVDEKLRYLIIFLFLKIILTQI
jgi:hypothetical protein